MLRATATPWLTHLGLPWASDAAKFKVTAASTSLLVTMQGVIIVFLASSASSPSSLLGLLELAPLGLGAALRAALAMGVAWTGMRLLCEGAMSRIDGEKDVFD
jgi:hypothetical protein